MLTSRDPEAVIAEAKAKYELKWFKTVNWHDPEERRLHTPLPDGFRYDAERGLVTVVGEAGAIIRYRLVQFQDRIALEEVSPEEYSILYLGKD